MIASRRTIGIRLAILLGVVLLAVAVVVFAKERSVRNRAAMTTSEMCTQADGVWTLVLGKGTTLKNSFECRFSATDSGKGCVDSLQCQGRCIAATADDGQWVGQCSKDKVVRGCYREIRFGLRMKERCVY